MRRPYGWSFKPQARGGRQIHFPVTKQAEEKGLRARSRFVKPPRKASNGNYSSSYRKPTQVDGQSMLRWTREPNLMNSANYRRNLGKRRPYLVHGTRKFQAPIINDQINLNYQLQITKGSHLLLNLGFDY